LAIKRVWHGWTTPENADTYERLLETEIFPGIEAKGLKGYRGIELLRRNLEDEVEFVTLMTFDSIEDVIAFQGEDYARCYVPESAQRVLSRWDERSLHFEVQADHRYDGES